MGRKVSAGEREGNRGGNNKNLLYTRMKWLKNKKCKEGKMESDRGRYSMTWCSHVHANTLHTQTHTQTKVRERPKPCYINTK